MTPAEAAERNARFYPDAKLHPCPFCNSQNLYIYSNAPSSDIQSWPHVACLECGAGQTTIEKWNTRAGYSCDGWVPMTFFGKPLLVHPDIELEASHALLVAVIRKIHEDESFEIVTSQIQG